MQMTAEKQDYSEVYQGFRTLYQNYMQFDRNNLGEIYSEAIVFRDPVHEIQGLDALKIYFDRVSGNLNRCHFEFIDELVTTDSAHITWEMTFSHPRLQSGKTIVLRGMTLIRFDNGKINYHEDAYDLGAMLYERIPLVGNITKWLKGRLS